MVVVVVIAYLPHIVLEENLWELVELGLFVSQMLLVSVLSLCLLIGRTSLQDVNKTRATVSRPRPKIWS